MQLGKLPPGYRLRSFPRCRDGMSRVDERFESPFEELSDPIVPLCMISGAFKRAQDVYEPERTVNRTEKDVTGTLALIPSGKPSGGGLTLSPFMCEFRGVQTHRGPDPNPYPDPDPTERDRTG